MQLSKTINRGLKSGISTTLQLSKIMVPIYLGVVFLKHSGTLEVMSAWLEPLMKLIGLPGEAAYALVIGNTINLYAAIGAMSAVSLTQKEITIIAIMLLISHNIFVETAVTKSCGIGVWPVIAVRFSLALIAGLAANLIL